MMGHTMRKFVNAALLFFSAAALCAAPAKKMIECSWSNPTTDVLRQNIAEFEAKIPYQGMRIYLTGRGEGKGHNHKTIFGKVRWKYEWFKEDVENLKNTKFTRFTDNFFDLLPGETRKITITSPKIRKAEPVSLKIRHLE